MESTLQVNGKFVVEVIDKDGNLKQRVEQHNRVVDTGLEQIASLIQITFRFQLTVQLVQKVVV